MHVNARLEIRYARFTPITPIIAMPPLLGEVSLCEMRLPPQYRFSPKIFASRYDIAITVSCFPVLSDDIAIIRFIFPPAAERHDDYIWCRRLFASRAPEQVTSPSAGMLPIPATARIDAERFSFLDFTRFAQILPAYVTGLGSSLLPRR